MPQKKQTATLELNLQNEEAKVIGKFIGNRKLKKEVNKGQVIWAYWNANNLGDGAKRVLTLNTIKNLKHKTEVALILRQNLKLRSNCLEK
jgi:hypothetical protein